MAKKYDLSVRDFLELSKSGSVDYSDFVAVFNRNIQKLEKKNLFREHAEIGGEKKGQLYGLPVSLKDCICSEGMQACSGSRILEGYMPPFDATSVSRIRDNGGKIFAKTNQDEFGFGTFSVNCAFGIPKNPMDEERTCGGSSGGAAALTAVLDMPHIAVAESTGGSISCPSAFCSVTGLTPTYGLVSRYGLIDYANSLDKIGPIGKSVYDVSLMLSIMAGHDAKDSTSIMRHGDNYVRYMHEGVKGMKIALPKEYFEASEKNVQKSVMKAVDVLESEGASVDEVSLKTTDYAIASYYLIATSEASSNLAKYCGLRYGYQPEVKGGYNEFFSQARSAAMGDEAKRRILLGTFARMSGYRDQYYMKAMKIRTLVIEDFKRIFGKYDVIAAPSMPSLPPKFSQIKKMTPAESYGMDVLTVPANLAGIPMISVPCGKMIGLHLISDHLKENRIISAAAAYERCAE